LLQRNKRKLNSNRNRNFKKWIPKSKLEQQNSTWSWLRGTQGFRGFEIDNFCSIKSELFGTKWDRKIFGKVRKTETGAKEGLGRAARGLGGGLGTGLLYPLQVDVGFA